MDFFTYHGARVRIAPTADMPQQFRPNARYEHVVQQTLNATGQWKEGESPIQTEVIDGIKFRPMAILITSNRRPYVQWGIHRGHLAREPQLSPFIDLPDELTSLFTIELVGPPERPTLIRAYPGDYTPPLPWMSSAKSAEHGLQACLRYWKGHAYQGTRLIKEGTLAAEPPSWFAA